ncbi:MAG: AbrB/MazE/SpoVT family DNA-binding domain-containing protein [Opitutales bacterium]
MLTRLSSKGQTVLPKAIREMARLEAGDELEVGYSGGMIVLRKPEPLDTRRVRRLLKEGRKLPEMTDDDRNAVDDAIRRVRRRASKE